MSKQPNAEDKKPNAAQEEKVPAGNEEHDTEALEEASEKMLLREDRT